MLFLICLLFTSYNVRVIINLLSFVKNEGTNTKMSILKTERVILKTITTEFGTTIITRDIKLSPVATKPKSHKCNRCGRWISSPVKVAGDIYGSGCAKKARLDKSLSDSNQPNQLSLIQETEQSESMSLIVPEAIIKSLPVKPITTTEIKQVGEIWLNNKVSDKCLDCDTHKPIFYKFALSNGKVLSCCCESCFEKHNYFNVA